MRERRDGRMLVTMETLKLGHEAIEGLEGNVGDHRV
jgi:hypothetical protein